MKVISKPCIIKGYARENRKFYNHCTIHPTYQWTNKKNAGKKLYRNSNLYLNIQNRKGKDWLRNVGGILLRLIRTLFDVYIIMWFVIRKDILSTYIFISLHSTSTLLDYDKWIENSYLRFLKGIFYVIVLFGLIFILHRLVS